MDHGKKEQVVALTNHARSTKSSEVTPVVGRGSTE